MKGPAFNSRDVDRIMSFFADDCTFLMARGPEPDGRRVHGKAAVRKALADRFRVITDMRWDHLEFRGAKILNKDTYWKLVEHRDRL